MRRIRLRDIRRSMEIVPDDMAKQDSSRKRRTKKAGSQNRSTTSSTTGKSGHNRKKHVEADRFEDLETGIEEKTPTSQSDFHIVSPEKSITCLTSELEQSFLELLSRGASPAAACRELGLSVSMIQQALVKDEEFRALWEEVNVTLSQNIQAALYRSAMEGNVSAQTYWLKSNPPPGWSPDSMEPLESIDEFFDELSDDELLDLARAMEINLPPEIEAKIAQAGDEPVT
ncbi:MAG: hypothetical protein IH899_16875 [Planctomycetes bacterium]|nr:hypothetical protein [Planctomycetota bacterium]